MCVLWLVLNAVLWTVFCMFLDIACMWLNILFIPHILCWMIYCCKVNCVVPEYFVLLAHHLIPWFGSLVIIFVFLQETVYNIWNKLFGFEGHIGLFWSCTSPAHAILEREKSWGLEGISFSSEVPWVLLYIIIKCLQLYTESTNKGVN